MKTGRSTAESRAMKAILAELLMFRSKLGGVRFMKHSTSCCGF